MRKLNIMICKDIVARIEAQGITGKKRDTLSIEMLAGALIALRSVNNAGLGDFEQEYQHLENVAFYLIAPRGYAEIVRMSNLCEETNSEQHTDTSAHA